MVLDWTVLIAVSTLFAFTGGTAKDLFDRRCACCLAASCFCVAVVPQWWADALYIGLAQRELWINCLLGEVMYVPVQTHLSPLVSLYFTWTPVLAPIVFFVRINGPWCDCCLPPSFAFICCSAALIALMVLINSHLPPSCDLIYCGAAWVILTALVSSCTPRWDASRWLLVGIGAVCPFVSSFVNAPVTLFSLNSLTRLRIDLSHPAIVLVFPRVTVVTDLSCLSVCNSSNCTFVTVRVDMVGAT